MALPHLDQLLKEIETYRLEAWDPQLALEGLKLVWTGYNKQTDKGLQSNAAAVLSRIAELDPTQAVKLCQK